MSKATVYKAYGVMIDGTSCNTTTHRSEEAAEKQANKLKRAYAARHLQISARWGYVQENGKIHRLGVVGLIED